MGRSSKSERRGTLVWFALTTTALLQLQGPSLVDAFVDHSVGARLPRGLSSSSSYGKTHRKTLALNVVPVTGGSLVALVTPFTQPPDVAVDWDALDALLDWHIEEAKTTGIVVLGTTGEASTLNSDEKDAVLKRAIQKAAGRGVPIIAGTGGVDTQATIAATRHAAELGADASLVVTPYYVKPPQRGLVAHFSAVAKAAPDLPLLLYNVPSRTGVDMTPETIAEIATTCNNVVGVKEATGDVTRVATLRDLCGPDFVLVSGDDGTSLDFVAAGGDGVISVTANVAPEQMRDTMTFGKTDLARAREIDADLTKLHDALFVEANPIPVKWALAKMGRIASGSVRLPLSDLDAAHHAVVEDALQAAAAGLASSSSSSSSSEGV